MGWSFCWFAVPAGDAAALRPGLAVSRLTHWRMRSKPVRCAVKHAALQCLRYAQLTASAETRLSTRTD
jgi:hypothetical protein